MGWGPAIAIATERIVTSIEQTHLAVADRFFAAFGPTVNPIRATHRAVSALVYRTIRVGGPAVGSRLAAHLTDPGSEDTASAVVNGLWGDALGRHQSRLGITMGIRDRTGAPRTLEAVSARPDLAPTGRLVILVHGLFETEACWWGTAARPGIAEALEADLSLTPISIRYNTGLRVSANGSRLSALLEELCAAWPVPVESIALVGRSMGGLVIRSACEAARTAGHHWIDDAGDVVTLGTPHRGAPLEKLVNVVAWGLDRSRETRPLADFLNGRSGGIKDLRFGAITDADWDDVDPDALLRDTVSNHPLPQAVNHHVVAGVITKDPTHPLGVLVGDLVVPVASGTGRRRVEATSVMIHGGTRHTTLLSEPAVVDQVLAWLAPDRND